jgi:hypothetical protein
MAFIAPHWLSVMKLTEDSRFVVINGVIVPAGYEFVAKDDYSRFRNG